MNINNLTILKEIYISLIVKFVKNCYHPFSCQQNKKKFLMLVHKENCFADLIFRCPKINFLFLCIYLDNFYLKYEPCNKNNNNNNKFLFRFLKRKLPFENGFPNFLICNLKNL